MESLLESVRLATKEAESPQQFFYWSTLAAIASVLKKNVYIDRHYFKVYPNIYVLLIAPSGMRKGLPVSLASTWVRKVGNTRVIEGRSSIQAIISELSKAHHNGTKVYADACALIASEEFTIGLIEDKQSYTILTDLYDSHSHPEWKNRTKGGGTETLKDVAVTMLGASNEPLLRDTITIRERYGGFIGRTFMVYGNKKNTINPLVEKPEQILNHEEIIAYLTELSTLKGEMLWTTGAKKAFSKWYHELVKGESEDDTGMFERFDTHVLKVAMLIHLSRSKELVLEEQDIKQAILACESLIKKPVVSTSDPKSSAHKKLWILEFLMKKGESVRTLIIQRGWHQFDNQEDFDLNVNILIEGKLVMAKTEKGSQKIFYELTQKGMEVLGYVRKKDKDD